jgi:hypothetical protein
MSWICTTGGPASADAQVSPHPLNQRHCLAALSPNVVFGHTVGAGHFDHIGVPDQINAMIRRFLDVYVDRVDHPGMTQGGTHRDTPAE